MVEQQDMEIPLYQPTQMTTEITIISEKKKPLKSKLKYD